jgi:hypothetical protein
MASLNETREVISGQLWVTKDKSTPLLMGVGGATIFGATYLQGPNLFGNDSTFPSVYATTMIGPLTNSDSPPPFIPGALSICGRLVNNSPYSLSVQGDAAIFDNCDVNLDINAGSNIYAGGFVKAQGEVYAFCTAHRLSNKKDKPFDMDHPTKPGWRLRHVCLEGPEIGVYLHGKNKGNVLELPDYWKGLVKQETISVHLTPIGKPHILYVEKIEDNKVYINSNIEEEPEYNYVIHASRYDDDLIVEYKGTSHLDYPGGNEGYEFSFENDNMERLVREVIEKRLDSMEKENGK